MHRTYIEYQWRKKLASNELLYPETYKSFCFFMRHSSLLLSSNVLKRPRGIHAVVGTEQQRASINKMFINKMPVFALQSIGQSKSILNANVNRC